MYRNEDDARGMFYDISGEIFGISRSLAQVIGLVAWDNRRLVPAITTSTGSDA
ncbi:MAG: hypothetical protein HY862_13700 [Chloroflexi bacterium]|nr:hypothetical protein [Chloroflexota bacterium]